ncbi:ABC transporter substrate-binding protein, partial [Streptomyces sp. NPDC057582]
MTASTTRLSTAAKSAKSRIAAVCAIAVAGTMLLTACGDQTKGGTKASEPTKSSSGASSPADLLPADIKAKGVITVGS